MTEAPCVVIFPGAFHPASCMDLLVALLRAAGFPTQAHTLRSFGSPTMGVADDEAHMRSVMKPLINSGRDVVLIVHSFAGIPGTSALSGLDKRGREARGEKGGILGVIYLAAFVPVEGDSVHELLGGDWEPWMEANESEGLVHTRDQARILFGDCMPAQGLAVTRTLQGQSIKAFRGPDAIPSKIGWREEGYNGRRAYIRCTLDEALPTPVQELFTQRSGVDWIIKSLEASHSPFLSMPHDVVKLVQGLVQEFLAA